MEKEDLIEKFENDIQEIWREYVNKLDRYAYNFGKEYLKNKKNKEIIDIIDQATYNFSDHSRSLQESAIDGSKS